jgi:PKD repeat protein
LNITEGTTNSFNVRLSSLPSASVTVSVSRTSGETNVVVLPDPTVLVFSPANWNVGQSVYVEALSDVDTNSGIATITCTDLGGTYSAKNVPATQTDTTVLPAVAGFNAATTIGYAPLTVTFTDTSTGNFITNRFWDFGDGATTNTLATTVSHTYTVAGSTSTVQLTLGNSLGESTTNRVDYIRVLPGIPPALPIYDAFNDSVTNSGIPTGWFCLAPGTPPANASHSHIDEGSLSYPGLQASAGNSFGLGNKTDDYSLLFTLTNLGTNETVYFSTLLRLNSATPTNMTGLIRLYDGADPFGSGISIGVGVTNNESVMGFSVNNSNKGFGDAASIRTPASYAVTGVTHLIVGSYTRGTNATSGLTQLWINPDSASFGTATPPAATLSTNSSASDAVWNRLDIISAGSGSWRTDWQMDEVRVATSWAAVVPAFSSPVADADGDGLPDDWETLYFGGATNANPGAICANGINTVLEAYVAGLNPNDPQSIFRAGGTPPQVLEWNSAAGRIYSVYWTTNLMNGFQCIASNLPWTQNSLTNPAPAASSFYKIDVQLE